MNRAEGVTGADRRVVSVETGGLGNRIKSWVSAMRLDAHCGVYWPLTPNMPAPFHALFENDCQVDRVPDGACEHISWRLAVLPEDEPQLPAGFTTVGSGTHPAVRAMGRFWWALTGRRTDRYRYMLFPKRHSKRSTRRDGRHIDLEYERIPAYFRQVYGQCFARIVVRREIQDRADDWARRHLDQGVTGVQVRTWRDHARRQNKYHKPSMARLRRLLAAAGPERRFLVVSDSDEVAPWLAAEIGAERVLQFPRMTSREDSYLDRDGMVEDLIDMLLLARTGELFASYLSTFSEVAWWLGGARARVEVF